MGKEVINNEEYLVSFTQGLTRDDLVYLNQALLSSNSKLKTNLAIAFIASLSGAIICFLQQMWIWGIVFSFIALVTVLVLPFLFKLVVKSSIVRKMNVLEVWNIKVAVNEEHIHYSFVTEDLTKLDPFNIKDIQKAIENKDYFLIRMNQQTSFIFKKCDMSEEEISSIRDIFTRHLILGMRFIQK